MFPFSLVLLFRYAHDTDELWFTKILSFFSVNFVVGGGGGGDDGSAVAAAHIFGIIAFMCDKLHTNHRRL